MFQLQGLLKGSLMYVMQLHVVGQTQFTKLVQA